MTSFVSSILCRSYIMWFLMNLQHLCQYCKKSLVFWNVSLTCCPSPFCLGQPRMFAWSVNDCCINTLKFLFYCPSSIVSAFTYIRTHIRMYVYTVIFLSIFCPWQQYEGWIRDIRSDTVPLDRIKLCICGHARVGKSAMRESLSAPFLRVTYYAIQWNLR